jgi:photosystem II stability/assembly factor-like uncharacterized protein
MKTKLINYLVLLLCISASGIYSQWTVLTSSGDRTLNSVSLHSPFYGFAVGDTGVIRKTANNGQTWSISNANTNLNLNGVFLIGSTTAIICGNQGSIFKTTNSGTNWVLQTSPAAYNYYDIDFINSTTGIIIGDDRRFAVTGNGGTNWLMGQLNITGVYPNLDIAAVDMVDNTTIYVGTADTLISGNYVAFIHKSTNNGVSFSSILTTSSPVTRRSTFADVQFLNPNTGWALSENMYLHRTTNGGSNWQVYQVGFPAKSMFFVNAATGYLCGDNGMLKKSTDGGINWLSQNSPVNVGLQDNVFYDTNRGFSVGGSGVIIGTFNGGTYVGITQTGNEVPSEFGLGQNFPNPFNPSTRISFDIPVRSFSKLVVYDILGNELRVLLRGDINAGKYETQFDASGLPSGTYFYRLESGSFSQTRKMILIK